MALDRYDEEPTEAADLELRLEPYYPGRRRGPRLLRLFASLTGLIRQSPSKARP